MSVKIFDTMTTATPNFPLAYAEKINVKLQDGTEDNLQNLFDNGELGGGGGDSSTTLTQQEYEALSEEQKLDGLYYTYDTKRIYKNGVQYGASDAEDIGYNNAESGIQATTVQGAIDKVVKKVDGLISDTTSSTTSTWSSQKTSGKIAEVETELNAKVDKTNVLTAKSDIATDDELYSASVINSELLDILKKVYPIGSVYINVTDINPFDILGFGTWERIAQNMTLWGASDSGQVGTIKDAGLPNITGEVGFIKSAEVSNYYEGINIKNGCFTNSRNILTDPRATRVAPSTKTDNLGETGVIDFNASRSNSIYGNSNTVQPPALVVNIWKRTA